MGLTSREIAAIKRIAQNADSDYQKVQKLNSKIEELSKERDLIQESLKLTEAPVVARYGYPSTTLVKKEVNPLFNADGTPKVDKDGRQMKQTKYIWVGFPEENQVVENPTVDEDFNVIGEETLRIVNY